MKIYNNPIALTQQFRHCGNAFRIDTYKGCNFGCKYCFATTRGGNINKDWSVADIEQIKKIFYKALETDKESKNIVIEMLRHKVPLHLGGMADPFQSREKEYKITYKLLELTKQYNYPMMISTKTAHLDNEYFDILDPNIHAFQVSLMSMNEDFIRKFELNTPTPKERKAFVQLLKDKNFWVSIRIQPLINIEEGKSVILQCGNIVDFITIEHIKIGNDNSNKIEMFKSMNLNPSDFVSVGREYEFKEEIKRKNIEYLKQFCKCPIGCGDNEIHELGDTLNCCGIDTINENFNNWIKYNSMYINKTNDKTQWFPKCSCHNCFNSECKKQGFNFNDYVDDYMSKDIVIKQCKVKF